MSTRITQVFKNENLWNHGINSKIKNAIQSNFRMQSWFSSQSRTLQNVLNHTFGNYYSTAAFNTLYGICALIKNNPKLRIYPNYLTISAVESETFANELMAYLNFPRINSVDFNFVFYHVPKGKSYLKPVLDNLLGPTRLQQIETHCITNPTHFIRVYKNFNNSGNNTITIFSDQYNKTMLYTLWTLLPHLMEITEHNTDDELTEEQQTHNARVEILYTLFGHLYDILQDSATTEYTDTEYDELEDRLLELTTKYANHFDFITGALSSFTARLAKIKNDVANTYFERELNVVKNNIATYEQNLESAYTKKAHLERQLNALKSTSEEDLKPFIDCITNTKAIEILNTTPKDMTLRITAPLQYFQESDFETYEKNPNSVYNQFFRTNPIAQKVFHKVFVTREYKLLLQAVIRMQIQENYNSTPLTFSAERTYNSPDLTQFPNPHLYHHDCWGSAKAEMAKNLHEGNYELVIMQMIAAVQSVNVAENTSFISGFLSDIKNVDALRRLLTFIVNTPEGPKEYSYQQILIYEAGLEKKTILDNAKKIIAESPKKYTQVEIPDDDDDDEE